MSRRRKDSFAGLVGDIALAVAAFACIVALAQALDGARHASAVACAGDIAMARCR